MDITTQELGSEEEWNRVLEEEWSRARRHGARDLLKELLRERFGELSHRVNLRLFVLNEQQLIRIAKEMLKAQSLRDLGLE